MKYPDEVTVLRATGADEYGNPGASWSSPTEKRERGFLQGSTCFMPPDADVRAGDRLRVAGRTYAVDGEPQIARSPSRPVLTRVAVKPLEA